MKWMHEAACRNKDTNVFFPEDDDFAGILVAKSICSNCTVKSECLDMALRLHEQYGIFGGMTPRDRYNYLRRQRRTAHRPLQQSLAI